MKSQTISLVNTIDRFRMKFEMKRMVVTGRYYYIGLKENCVREIL